MFELFPISLLLIHQIREFFIIKIKIDNKFIKFNLFQLIFTCNINKFDLIEVLLIF